MIVPHDSVWIACRIKEMGHGTQPHPISEGSLGGAIPGPLWKRGTVSFARGGLALAGGLPLPEMRRGGALHRGAAPTVSVQRLPPADIADGRHHFQLDQAPADRLVSRDVPRHADQAGHLLDRAGPSPGVTQTTAWKIKTKLAEVMRAVGDEE